MFLLPFLAAGCSERVAHVAGSGRFVQPPVCRQPSLGGGSRFLEVYAGAVSEYAGFGYETTQIGHVAVRERRVEEHEIDAAGLEF